jgi:integrase
MGIWKDKLTRGWVYKFEFQKKAHGARGFKTRREAEAARVKRREEVREQSVAEIKTATGFKSVANDYLDVAKRKFVKDVYLRKVNVFRKFRFTIGDRPIDRITPRHIHDYLKSLESNSLYNEHRHELSSLFNWAKRIYAAQLPFLVNPCIGVESMTHVTAEKIIPTEKEVLRLIAAAHPGDERDIILVCLQTLGRIDEVLRLRWHEDVNFDKRYVILWTRKRKNGVYEPDALPMNQDLYDVLLTRWKDRKQDKWVFYNEGTEDRYKHRPKMMRSICCRAGTSLYGFHSLRHFMASYLMDEEKVSLKTVSGLLRHKNVRTTEIYLHSVDSSQLAASDKIQGKFTLKLTKPPQTAATETKGATE